MQIPDYLKARKPVVGTTGDPIEVQFLSAIRDSGLCTPETIVADGEIHVMGIMRKWVTKAPSYAELGHALPSGLPPAVEKRAKECVRAAIRALGIDFGCVNMDMLITEDGKVYIIDIGARMGGNLIGPCVIPYGTGID